MKTAVVAGTAPLLGEAIGYLLGLRSQIKASLPPGKGETGEKRVGILRSVTRFLFVTTQIFASGWVSWSYIIATYSTVVLGQPFPVEELSKQALTTLLGMSGLKVVENIFEHNEGVVFGRSQKVEEPQEEVPTEETKGMEEAEG